MKMIYAQKPTLITAPTELPVTLDEAKLHLRVDGDDEDAKILSFIRAATSHLDGHTGILGKCLVSQTWRQDYIDFPLSDVLRLPFDNPSSLTVQYVNRNGDTATLPESQYHLIIDALGASVLLAYNQVWPQVDDVPNAVQVTATYGYGDAADVPDDIKDAINLHVAALYEYREALGEKVYPTMAYEALVSKYIRVGIS